MIYVLYIAMTSRHGGMEISPTYDGIMVSPIPRPVIRPAAGGRGPTLQDAAIEILARYVAYRSLGPRV